MTLVIVTPRALESDAAVSKLLAGGGDTKTRTSITMLPERTCRTTLDTGTPSSCARSVRKLATAAAKKSSALPAKVSARLSTGRYSAPGWSGGGGEGGGEGGGGDGGGEGGGDGGGGEGGGEGGGDGGGEGGGGEGGGEGGGGEGGGGDGASISRIS